MPPGSWGGMVRRHAMYINQKYTFDDSDGELIAQFTAFMVKVVTSAKIDYIRRQRHWKWEVLTDKPPEPVDDKTSPERWLSAVSDGEFYFAEERISKALSDLTTLRRRILELSFIDELSAQEIAEILGCSVKYVYKQKHAAIKKLRDILLNGGEADE